MNEFDVSGSKHYVADAGDVGQWDSKRAALDVEKIVQETRRFWGFLPFKRYVFLSVFRQGGGGLEHLNSTLLTANSSRATIPDTRWLAFVSHEYFHAFNVKRLRPIELGPFDYEHPPNTKVSYYVKGPVVGFLLDAKIQRVTRGKKSLGDVMRLAYKRYSGERGFTPEQFLQTTEEVAGVDLKEWFRKALSSTEELDYTEALDWFGLRFAAPGTTWKLEERADATDAQKNQLRRWVGKDGK